METAHPATSRSGLPAASPAGFFRLVSRQADRAVRLSLPSLGLGKTPHPHARQDVDASSVTPACGEPAETKKARYVVALSRVLRSVRNSFPAVRPRTDVRPQARAKLGKAVRMRDWFHNQEFSAAAARENLRGAGAGGTRPRLPAGGCLRVKAAERTIPVNGGRRHAATYRFDGAGTLGQCHRPSGRVLDPSSRLHDRRRRLHHRRRDLHCCALHPGAADLQAVACAMRAC